MYFKWYLLKSPVKRKARHDISAISGILAIDWSTNYGPVYKSWDSKNSKPVKKDTLWDIFKKAFVDWSFEWSLYYAKDFVFKIYLNLTACYYHKF